MLQEKFCTTYIIDSRAKDLRQQTTTEKIIWKKLRAKRFHGLKFRRQVPLGQYIVDFACIEKYLILECDGDSHYEEGKQKYDKRRDQYFTNRGFKTVRLGNRATQEDIDTALNIISRECGIVYEEG
jgi:very-short-patch-repair endonuclease